MHLCICASFLNRMIIALGASTFHLRTSLGQCKFARRHTIIGGVITRNQVADIRNRGHVPANPFESAIIAPLKANCLKSMASMSL